MNRSPWYSHVLAVFLGLVSAAAPASLPIDYPSLAVALLVSTAIFGLAGLLCGTFWPVKGARWAGWIVAPGVLLVTFGLISSGELPRFLSDDLPFLAAGFAGSAMGALAGSRLRGDRSSRDDE